MENNKQPEWWETEEGIEKMKQQELQKFKSWRDETPWNKNPKPNLGKSIKLGGN